MFGEASLCMNTSRYHIFCRVVDLGSFTKAAAELGYTQSAVSQIIRTLENELGSVLLERRRDGLRLTSDGQQYMPYLRHMSAAEQALAMKHQEMRGLEDSVVTIDTFTSVSRNILPPLMSDFRQQYPGVDFVLRQGDYASIYEDLLSGNVDLGFLSPGPGWNDASDTDFSDLQLTKLYDDDMVVVLPPDHPLTRKRRISLEDLAQETLILLDEGVKYNTVLDGFRRVGLEPSIEYEVYDDYSIIAMIRQGMGISLLFRRVVHGFSEGVEIRELSQQLTRPVCLAWKNRDTLPAAARRFADYILDNIKRQ